jgi:adenosylcobyric acid synthase
MIEERTGVPVLGVVPMVADLRLPEEDGMSVEREKAFGGGGPLSLAVIRFPRISNFDDFDPFGRAGVSVRYVTRPEELAGTHIVALPGTKSTIADLRWMKSRGMDTAVRGAASRGATVVGICGGYQMLGERLDDPQGADSGHPDSETGLGMLPAQTVFYAAKSTQRVRFRALAAAGAAGLTVDAGGHGYEIHTGQTALAPTGSRGAGFELMFSDGSTRPDGAVSSDGRIFGCYVHGMFDAPEVLAPLLAAVSARYGLEPPRISPFSLDAELDRLADVVQSSIDMDALHEIIGL